MLILTQSDRQLSRRACCGNHVAVKRTAYHHCNPFATRLLSQTLSLDRTADDALFNFGTEIMVEADMRLLNERCRLGRHVQQNVD
jgi:hypothetical protein